MGESRSPGAGREPVNPGTILQKQVEAAAALSGIAEHPSLPAIVDKLDLDPISADTGREHPSAEAERVGRTRKRREMLDRLRAERSEEALWQTVLAFQNYPFRTSSGLPFTYTVKRGRSGEYTGELIVSRKEGSKTLTRSSVLLVFQRVTEQWSARGEAPEYSGPKAIGQIFGISYIYSLFWRFGLITVPEKVEKKLKQMDLE